MDTNGDVIMITRIGHVEVVRLCRKLCSQRVDLLNARNDPKSFSFVTDARFPVEPRREANVASNLAKNLIEHREKLKTGCNSFFLPVDR